MKTIKIILILQLYVKAYSSDILDSKDLFIKINQKHSLLKKNYLFLKSHNSHIVKIEENKKKKRIYLHALSIGETDISAYLSEKEKIITIKVIVIPDKKRSKRKILFWDKGAK